MAYEPGSPSLFLSRAEHFFRAIVKLHLSYSQQPKMKNKYLLNICLYYIYNTTVEFIFSSETKCPKSGQLQLVDSMPFAQLKPLSQVL